VCKTNDESPRRFESDPELNKILTNFIKFNVVLG